MYKQSSLVHDVAGMSLTLEACLCIKSIVFVHNSLPVCVKKAIIVSLKLFQNFSLCSCTAQVADMFESCPLQNNFNNAKRLLLKLIQSNARKKWQQGCHHLFWFQWQPITSALLWCTSECGGSVICNCCYQIESECMWCKGGNQAEAVVRMASRFVLIFSHVCHLFGSIQLTTGK